MREHSSNDGGPMAYQLNFFCRSGEAKGDEALDRLLDYLLETGEPLVGEWQGPYVDPVAAPSWAPRTVPVTDQSQTCSCLKYTWGLQR